MAQKNSSLSLRTGTGTTRILKLLSSLSIQTSQTRCEQYDLIILVTIYASSDIDDMTPHLGFVLKDFTKLVNGLTGRLSRLSVELSLTKRLSGCKTNLIRFCSYWIFFEIDDDDVVVVERMVFEDCLQSLNKRSTTGSVMI